MEEIGFAFAAFVSVLLACLALSRLSIRQADTGLLANEVILSMIVVAVVGAFGAGAALLWDGLYEISPNILYDTLVTLAVLLTLMALIVVLVRRFNGVYQPGTN